MKTLKRLWREALRRLRSRLNPPRYYVAIYGDMGLEVTFFWDSQSYDEAVEQAEEDHEHDRIDSWVCGDMEFEQ